MACDCETGVNKQDTAEANLGRLFDRYWPPSLPFPPAAPWLAVAVDRAKIRPVFVRFGASFGALAEGKSDYEALGNLVAMLVASQERSVRKAREGAMNAKGKKKPKDPGDCTPHCCERAEEFCGPGNVTSCSCKDGWCNYYCKDGRDTFGDVEVETMEPM